MVDDRFADLKADISIADGLEKPKVSKGGA